MQEVVGLRLAFYKHFVNEFSESHLKKNSIDFGVSMFVSNANKKWKK